jgi:hypothetical protein
MAATGVSRAPQATQNATVPGGVTPFPYNMMGMKEIYIYIPIFRTGFSLWLASD